MAKKEKDVTIRIKIADYKLEVQGPKKWAEETIKKFVERIEKQQAKTLNKLKGI